MSDPLQTFPLTHENEPAGLRWGTENPDLSMLGFVNARLDAETAKALARKLATKTCEIQEGLVPESGSYVLPYIISEATERLKNHGLDPSSARFGRPTSRAVEDSGIDLSVNVMPLARSTLVDAKDLAETFADDFGDSSFFSRANAQGPYVNFEINLFNFAPQILAEVSELGDRYGYSRDGSPEIVVVDYSSPNVAKNMTVAHLRSTIIGQSLVNLIEATGDIPFGINHIGDWGTQFGNIIYEYKKELAEKGDEFLEEFEADPTATLMRIYRAFNERRDSDPEAVAEARQIFRRLEEGDPELVELWLKFRECSLRDFGPVYQRLGVDFDSIQGESFYEEKMGKVKEDGLKSGVLKIDQEGSIVFPAQALINPENGADLPDIMKDQDGNPRNEVVFKPNGGTVYLTRDLAAIFYRAEELGAKRIIYVIGKEQKPHCLLLFNIASQLGYMALGDAVHVSFGHINVDGRKMKSREGKVTLLGDLMDEAKGVALEGLVQRGRTNGKSVTVDESLAESMAIGSMIFDDLSHQREKDIEFKPDLAKSQREGGAVYIQYTHARLCSLLDRVDSELDISVMPEKIHPEERRVLIEIARMPMVLKEASRTLSPHVVANYLSSFCQYVNEMYHNLPVIGAETEEERQFRINILSAARQVMANTAKIVQLKLPERM